MTYDDLEKHNTIWDKVSADNKNGFNNKPLCNKSFLKTKIKSNDDDVTDFHHKEIRLVDSNHTCLALISLDAALKKDDNYYLQVFLKEFKYIEKKVIRHINSNLSAFSSSNVSDEK